MHSSTLYSVILGQWLREVCVIICPWSAYTDAKRLQSFGQFNTYLDMFYCMKSSPLNIQVTWRDDKFLISVGMIRSIIVRSVSYLDSACDLAPYDTLRCIIP